MVEAFLFSPFLPLNTGNVVSTEPMAAERPAWSGVGLTQELGRGTKPGTFSWQGGFNNAGAENPRPASTQGPAHTQKEPLGEQTAHWEAEKYSRKRR